MYFLTKCLPYCRTKQVLTISRCFHFKNVLWKNSGNSAKENPVGWNEAKPFHQIPGPKQLPIIGNVLQFMPFVGEYYDMDFLDVHKKLNKDYGRICSMKIIPGQPMVLLFQPNDIELMFRQESVWPIRPELKSLNYYRNAIRKDVFKDVGSLLENGEKWYKFRTTVNPIMMQTRTVQQYIPAIDSVALDFINALKDLTATQPNGIMPDDFLNELHKWSLESIGTIALDTRLGCLEKNLTQNSESQILINSVLQMFDLIFKLDFLPSFWKIYPTPDYKKFVKTMDTITTIILKNIDKAMKKIETEDVTKREYEMSALQKLIKKDRQIAITMAIDMLTAGVDTTSKTLGAALYYLSKNKNSQSKLREEVKNILPSPNSVITREALEDAAYLKATIKETQRLAPIGPANARVAVKNMIIAGYQIPKNTNIMCANLLLSTTNEHFLNAKEFIPERWLRDSTNESLSYKNVHPFVSLPFGFGPRSCIGKRMALLELQIIIARIIRNFEICWPHKEEAKFKTGLLYGIVNPINLQFKTIS